MIYFGVVEAINDDPDKMGRVRVRVRGIHSDNLQDIPTVNLPLAPIVMQGTNTSVSGLGWSPTGIEKGANVIVQFLDEGEFQLPIIMGTICGKPLEGAKTSVGFHDPSGELPKYTDESDVNRSARGEDNEQLTSRKSGVLSPEPETKADPTYPYNKTLETVSGHLIEYDDTPGKERILLQHKSGSFIEMHPNGDVVIRCKGDLYSSSNGKHEVVSSGVNLGSDATEAMVLGDKMMTLYNSLITSYKSHVHPTPSGPSSAIIFGPSIPPTPASAPSSMSTDQLSSVNKTK